MLALRRNTLSITSVFLLIIFILTLTGCRQQPKRTEKEQLTVDRLKPYWRPLEDYKINNFTYPNHFFDICGSAGLDRPINPYTDEPMIELANEEFDSNVSPGNIYYKKVINDEGTVINCQVIIYGEKGKITTYHHSEPISAL